MMPLLTAIAGPIVKGLFGIIDQAVEDKDVANKIKAEIASRQQDLIQTELKGAIEIILAEAKGNWLQRSWRPMLMLIAMAIIANNYILVPYLSMFTDKVAVLELPDGLWTLLVTGVGGYVVGRSAEKAVTAWKSPDAK
jgi:hypothetical protein